MFSVLIADDEKLSRDTIRLLLEDQHDISDIYDAGDGKTALSMALELTPDILFLDIEMPGISGIEVAKQLPEGMVVIFATAFNGYAVAAFELNAFDYLLKPFDDNRFLEVLQKAREKVRVKQHSDYSRVGQLIQQMLNKKQYNTRLMIKAPGRTRFIDIDQINYICNAGNFVEIHLKDGKQVVQNETLSFLEEQLDPDVFVRIHRSSIVRRAVISEFRPNDNGDYSVVLTSGKVLALSRSNRYKFEELTK